MGKHQKAAGKWVASFEIAGKAIHAKQLWTYELGERVADRIEFEELALSSVEPSLGPTVPLTETSKQVNEGQSLHALPKVCALQFSPVDSSMSFLHRYLSSTPLLYIPPWIKPCIQLLFICRHFWRVMDRGRKRDFIYGCSLLHSLFQSQ